MVQTVTFSIPDVDFSGHLEKPVASGALCRHPRILSPRPSALQIACFRAFFQSHHQRLSGIKFSQSQEGRPTCLVHVVLLRLRPVLHLRALPSLPTDRLPLDSSGRAALLLAPKLGNNSSSRAPEVRVSLVRWPLRLGMFGLILRRDFCF